MAIQTYTQQAEQHNIVQFNPERNRITYIAQNKSRNYDNPEEKVQAEIYSQLILQYKYPQNRVKCFVPVTMGSSTKEADIVVYQDDECLQPLILVECKQQEVSEAEFIQAIEQAYSYAYALPNQTKWLWITSQIKNSFKRVEKDKNTQDDVADIPYFGSDRVAPYKFVKGGGVHTYIDENGKTQHQNFQDITPVAESELTNRFKQAHNALWAGGELNPSEAFDELDKLVFCKILDERQARKNGTPYDFQVITIEGKDTADTTQKTNQALAERIKKLYEYGKSKDKEVFRDNIRLSNERIRTITEYLQDVNLNKTDLDSKGKAFETFMGSFFRGDFGQYFTPRNVVKFIVDVLPITHDDFVLDTSCGSGGFLLHALDKVRKQADEYFDVESTEHYRYWHDFAEKKLFGIEINEQIARTAKMNMIIHDDGHTNVISADGLLTDELLQKQNSGFKFNHFDFILTNPPFGSSVKQTEKAYLSNYRFGQTDVSWLDLKNTAVKNRDSQKTEILFIEQCHNFLKELGYLAIVIPDGILTNSSLQAIRNQIEEDYRIVAVVSLPATAFTATGAGVKSSVLFLRKYPKKYSEKIRNLKADLQQSILKAEHYADRLKEIETAKKHVLDNPNFNDFGFSGSLKDLKKTDEYKAWKTEQSAEFTEQINQLKQELEDIYLTQKQRTLPDYPIFMAIAEQIGYDATGKDTAVNELSEIASELQRFIETVVGAEKYE